MYSHRISKQAMYCMYVYVVITSNGEGLNDNNIMLFTDGILSDYIDEMQDTINTQRKMVRCTGVIFVNISHSNDIVHRSRRSTSKSFRP